MCLAGVRRVGKTVLAKEFDDSEFLNCNLPGEVWRLEDPEAFFKSVRKPLMILDEVHQLPDPSRILKIATDAFPHLRVLATGSSTLAASRKFRDTLTGRKRVVALTPVEIFVYFWHLLCKWCAYANDRFERIEFQTGRGFVQGGLGGNHGCDARWPADGDFNADFPGILGGGFEGDRVFKGSARRAKLAFRSWRGGRRFAFG